MIWTSLSQMDKIRANDRQDHHCATIAVFNLLDIGLLISKVCLATAKKQAYAPKGWKLLGYRWATVQATHVHQTRPKVRRTQRVVAIKKSHKQCFVQCSAHGKKKKGASALSQQDQACCEDLFLFPMETGVSYLRNRGITSARTFLSPRETGLSQ